MSLSKIIAISTTPLVLALSIACAENDMLMTDGSLNSSADFDENFTDDTGLDTSDTLLIEADTWSIDANLILIDGGIDAEGSSFTATFWGEETELCTTNLTIDNNGDGAADTGTVIQDDLTAGLIGQWSLHFQQDDFCSDLFPTNIVLGVGELDSQLIPSVVSAGLGPDTLNGLYIQQQLSDPALYVFGAVGTQEQFDGFAGPLTDAPIPDGDYIAQTLYLLPLIAD